MTHARREVVITGGGTGGHIYPALEVAKELKTQGHQIVYLGSLCGQEGAVCSGLDIEFHGFGSSPLYSPMQMRGWKSLFNLLLATAQVKKHLRVCQPNAIFSTGGYSAAPVMAAARSLKIPYVIHEANSVPGRSNRMFATAAHGFSCAFEATQKLIPKAIRTGQPIRAELRQSVKKAADESKDLVFCLGGSQGSVFLNGVFPKNARISKSPLAFLLAAGRSNFVQLDKSAFPPSLTVVPYLETEQIVEAYGRAKVVVARSGSTVAELAMFGIPSVLIPLPTSAGDHQLKNAEEFVAFGGAKLLRQSDATPERLAQCIDGWVDDETAYREAQVALRNWDRPGATRAIAALVNDAVKPA